MGVVPDPEVLYERFEVVAALAYLEAEEEQKLAQKLEVHEGGVRMPVGRIAWRESSRMQISHELKSNTSRNALLRAGFGKGKNEFLDMFLVNLERISERIAF